MGRSAQWVVCISCSVQKSKNWKPNILEFFLIKKKVWYTLIYFEFLRILKNFLELKKKILHWKVFANYFGLFWDFLKTTFWTFYCGVFLMGDHAFLTVWDRKFPVGLSPFLSFCLSWRWWWYWPCRLPHVWSSFRPRLEGKKNTLLTVLGYFHLGGK